MLHAIVRSDGLLAVVFLIIVVVFLGRRDNRAILCDINLFLHAVFHIEEREERGRTPFSLSILTALVSGRKGTHTFFREERGREERGRTPFSRREERGRTPFSLSDAKKGDAHLFPYLS